MADTIRDRTTILGLYADNTAGDVSPQDARDMIVSVHGVMGGIYVQGSTVSQAIGGDSTGATKLTNFNLDMGTGYGVTEDSTGASDLQVGTAGAYEVDFQALVKGTTGQTYTFTLWKNSTSTVFAASVPIANTPWGHVGLKGLVSLSASDTMEIRAHAGTTGQTVTLRNGYFYTKRLA